MLSWQVGECGIVSIIIPAYGTEPHIQSLIEEVGKLMVEEYEILVQTEKGYGRAILTGVKKSRGRVVVIIDADGSHNPIYIPEMIAKLKNADLVLGSRYIKGGQNKDVPIRRFVSVLFCLLVRALFRLDIRDPMSGFIVAKKDVFTKLKLNPIGYKLALEILVKGRREIKVSEHPIIFEQCKAGKKPVKLSNIVQAIKTLALIIRLLLTSEIAFQRHENFEKSEA